MNQFGLFETPATPKAEPAPPPLLLYFHGLISVGYCGFYTVDKLEPGRWGCTYTRFDTLKVTWRRKRAESEDDAKKACERHHKSLHPTP